MADVSKSSRSKKDTDRDDWSIEQMREGIARAMAEFDEAGRRAAKALAEADAALKLGSKFR